MSMNLNKKKSKSGDPRDKKAADCNNTTIVSSTTAIGRFVSWPDAKVGIIT